MNQNQEKTKVGVLRPRFYIVFDGVLAGERYLDGSPGKASVHAIFIRRAGVIGQWIMSFDDVLRKASERLTGRLRNAKVVSGTISIEMEDVIQGTRTRKVREVRSLLEERYPERFIPLDEVGNYNWPEEQFPS